MCNFVLPTWTIHRGDGPLVATAIHQGDAIREDLIPQIALDATERLREEDPYTDRWTRVADSTIIVHRSRFECDLNRPRPAAFYTRAEDAWGLNVWRVPLTAEQIAESLALYDRFYAELRTLLDQLVRRHGRVAVYDIHSYNHFRGGPDQPADPETNPEVNVGTGSLDRDRWGRIVDRFIQDLRTYPYFGRNLDVRENIRFQGGEMARWTHANYPSSVCVLAIEIKKFFMNEWTGVPDWPQIDELERALAATTVGVRDELRLP